MGGRNRMSALHTMSAVLMLLTLAGTTVVVIATPHLAAIRSMAGATTTGTETATLALPSSFSGVSVGGSGEGIGANGPAAVGGTLEGALQTMLGMGGKAVADAAVEVKSKEIFVFEKIADLLADPNLGDDAYKALTGHEKPSLTPSTSPSSPPSSSPSSSPSVTASQSLSAIPSASESSSESESASAVASPSPSTSESSSPSESPAGVSESPSPSHVVPPTPSETAEASPSSSPLPPVIVSDDPSPSPPPSESPFPSVSAAASASAMASESPSPSPSPSLTPPRSPSPSLSLPPAPSPSPSQSAAVSPSPSPYGPGPVVRRLVDRVADVADDAGLALADRRSLAAEQAAPWRYDDGGNGAAMGRGPDAWARLAGDGGSFAACGYGVRQSPIDMAVVTRASALDARPRLDYAPVSVVVHRTDGRHGPYLRLAFGSGSALAYAGRRYRLTHATVRVPSEHTIAGKAFAVEVQYMHAAEEDDDDQGAGGSGNWVALSVLHTLGLDNPMLDRVVEAIEGAGWTTTSGENPSTGTESRSSEATIALEAASVKLPVPLFLADAIPKDVQTVGGDGGDGAAAGGGGAVRVSNAFFAYDGSMTTPPCAETVRWFVLAKPVEVSASQVKALQAAVGGGATARPPQSPNGRVVDLTDGLW